MPTSIDLVHQHNIDRTFDTSSAGGGRVPTIDKHAVVLDATTTPAISDGGFGSKALAAGAMTLDFRALVMGDGRTADFNTLKIRTLKLTNAGAAPMRVRFGAANPYTGFGAAFDVTIPAGGHMCFYDGGNGVAVSATVKTLDVTGTGTEVLQYSVTAGA